MLAKFTATFEMENNVSPDRGASISADVDSILRATFDLTVYTIEYAIDGIIIAGSRRGGLDGAELSPGELIDRENALRELAARERAIRDEGKAALAQIEHESADEAEKQEKRMRQVMADMLPPADLVKDRVAQDPSNVAMLLRDWTYSLERGRAHVHREEQHFIEVLEQEKQRRRKYVINQNEQAFAHLAHEFNELLCVHLPVPFGYANRLLPDLLLLAASKPPADQPLSGFAFVVRAKAIAELMPKQAYRVHSVTDGDSRRFEITSESGFATETLTLILSVIGEQSSRDGPALHDVILSRAAVSRLLLSPQAVRTHISKRVSDCLQRLTKCSPAVEREEILEQ